ncbi:MAG TPA: DNA polymerase III subunit beta, partial [Candidatus Paceibacterota bacterium]|nr:DNA polymerase III subunit beta [Candidatus Paceibacterota bacterium]
MKIECSKERLKEAVFLAERVTGKNLSLPILSSVMLAAERSVLTVRATNLDIGVEIEVPAKIEQEGSVALNATVLSGFLGNLYKEEKVTLDLKEDNIHVSTDRSSTLIKGYPIDDFPLIPHVADGVEFRLEAKRLVEGLKSVSYAAALSDIKPEIASVYVYYDDGYLVFVSTDSFRLAEKRIPVDESAAESVPIIVPHKNVAEIIRIFDSLPGEVRINANKNQVSLYAEGVHFTTRVIDGVYPDYRQIMPKQFLTEVSVNKAELMQVLKLSNVFSDKFNQIDLSVDPAKGELEINARNQDVGENTASAKIQGAGEAV